MGDNVKPYTPEDLDHLELTSSRRRASGMPNLTWGQFDRLLATARLAVTGQTPGYVTRNLCPQCGGAGVGTLPDQRVVPMIPEIFENAMADCRVLRDELAEWPEEGSRESRRALALDVVLRFAARAARAAPSSGESTQGPSVDDQPVTPEHLTLIAAWEVVCSYFELWNDGADEDAAEWLKRLRETVHTPSEAPTVSEDAARLDWLERVRPRVGLGEDGEARLLARKGVGAPLAVAPTIRAAIDAARTGELTPAPTDRSEGASDDAELLRAIQEKAEYVLSLDISPRAATTVMALIELSKRGQLRAQRAVSPSDSGPAPTEQTLASAALSTFDNAVSEHAKRHPFADDSRLIGMRAVVRALRRVNQSGPAPTSEAVTRFEVIDHRKAALPGDSSIGRIYSVWNCRISLSYQDAGRTLKVFVDDGEASNTPAGRGINVARALGVTDEQWHDAVRKAEGEA